MEDVEDVIVSSGPEHLAELAQLLGPHHQAGRDRLHGPGRPDVERLQVLLLPDVLRGQAADAGDEGLLRDRARSGSTTRSSAVRPGATTRTSRSSGRRRRRRGATRRRTRPPPTSGATASGSRSTTRRSSRASGRSTIRSRSSPAWCSRSRRSTARRYEWGVRIEEMLIVHEDRTEIICELPGGGDHRSHVSSSGAIDCYWRGRVHPPISLIC